MKNTHHIPLLLLAIATALFMAALYGYVWHRISLSVSQTETARAALSVEQDTKSDEQRLQQEYATSAAGRSRLDGLFIPADDAVTFIETVEGFGKVSGSPVTLSAITADPLTGAPAGTVGTVSAQVVTQGSWASVMKTLDLAESMPYASAVDNIRLDTSVPADSRATARIWSLSFDLRALLLVSSSSPRT